MQTKQQTENVLVIVVAGATGQLGQRIVAHLAGLGARPKALVRQGTNEAVLQTLRSAGAEPVMVNYNNGQELADACIGATCIVSALSGLKDVIVEGQSALLVAAVKAGVKKFIPSDYCIDYMRLPDGSNRNLDLRREFQQRLDAAPIKATSILNGMFTDLLAGQAPLVQFKWRRVLYWGDPDQPLDFTTLDDTAAFTAKAAIEADTPRFLRIAGETITSRELCEAASSATGQSFKLTRVGGLRIFKAMITVAKTLFPQSEKVFPAWQGMQYLHNMYTGLPKLHSLDNNRYPGTQWTSVEEVLQKAKEESGHAVSHA